MMTRAVKPRASCERTSGPSCRGRGATVWALALLLGPGVTATASAGFMMVEQYDIVESFDVPIPDLGSASVEIDVPAHGTIFDLDVDIVIEHTWQGDLIIELEKDGGPTATLLYRPGDSTQSVGTSGFGADNFGTGLDGPFIFDDEATAFYDAGSPAGIGALADPGIDDVGGSWIPYGGPQPDGTQTLGIFDGLDIFGTWRLNVSDNFTGDTGTIQQFSLHAQVSNLMPVPSTLALVGLGLTGMMAAGRRRSRKGPSRAAA